MTIRRSSDLLSDSWRVNGSRIINGNINTIKVQEIRDAKPALMSGGISRHHAKQKPPPRGSLSQRPSFDSLIRIEKFLAVSE
jgi:hypothetical protein